MNAWFARVCMVLLLALAARTASAQQPRPPAPAIRQEVVLTDGWLFHKGDAADGPALNGAADAAGGWEKVSVPHTWNGLDGEDGGSNYYRGDCWYRRNLTVDQSMAGKELFLRFGAANRKADVFINGQSIGSHAGGEAAFCFDVTAAVHPGDNLLAVKVSNRDDPTIPPLSADFTFFGGLYRPVSLLVFNPVHISPMDFASSGVYITTSDVTAESAKVSIRVLVQNRRRRPARQRWRLPWRGRTASHRQASMCPPVKPARR